MSTNDLQSTLEIKEKNILNINYNTTPNTDLQSNIDITKCNDLTGIINITTPSDLKSNLSIYGFRTNNLNSNITISSPGKANILSNIDITTIDSKVLNINYNTLDTPDLSSNLTIAINKNDNLFSSIDIPYIRTETLTPIEDSFIDNNLPTFNYGLSNTLYVGREDQYRTLIKFNFDNIRNKSLQPEKIKIKEAFLELETPSDKNIFLEIFKNIENWGEKSVTWKNQPLTERTGIKDIKFNNKKLKINILDLVKDWYSNKDNNYGIMIKSLNNLTNEIQTIYSSEYSSLSKQPELTIKYYDSSESGYLDSTELFSNISIPNLNDLQSNITIKSINRPEINGNINVKYRLNNDIAGNLNISNQRINNLNSNILINKPIIPSNIDIPSRNDLNCSIKIKQKINSNINSNLFINKPIMPSSINLKIHNNLVSSINIRKSDNNNLFGNISINKNNMPSNISILHNNDIDGSMNIKALGKSNVDSNITINKPGLPAKIDLVISSYIDSNLIVRQNKNDDLNSSISIKRDDNNNLTCQITPRPFKINELPITGTVVYSSLIPSTIVIKNGDERIKIPDIYNPNNNDKPRKWKNESNLFVNKDK